MSIESSRASTHASHGKKMAAMEAEVLTLRAQLVTTLGTLAQQAHAWKAGIGLESEYNVPQAAWQDIAALAHDAEQHVQAILAGLEEHIRTQRHRLFDPDP